MELLSRIFSSTLLILSRRNIYKYMIGEIDLTPDELDKIQEYLEKMKDNALRQLERAGAAVADNLGEVHLGGSSGSEAVRQARLNASDVDKKPNRVEIEDNGRN